MNFFWKKHIFINNQRRLFCIFFDNGEQSFETNWLIIVVHKHRIKSIISIKKHPHHHTPQYNPKQQPQKQPHRTTPKHQNTIYIKFVSIGNQTTYWIILFLVIEREPVAKHTRKN